MSDFRESWKLKVVQLHEWTPKPKTVFEFFLNPENRPIGPHKVKNDPKIKSKLNVRIERNKEN